MTRREQRADTLSQDAKVRSRVAGDGCAWSSLLVFGLVLGAAWVSGTPTAWADATSAKKKRPAPSNGSTLPRESDPLKSGKTPGAGPTDPSARPSTRPATRQDASTSEAEVQTPPVSVVGPKPKLQGPPAPGGIIHREGALESSPLEDILLEKGIITREDWLRIKADEERRAEERSTVSTFFGSPRWFERIRMFGFTQMRYNGLGNPNGNLVNWQDPSVGTHPNGQPNYLVQPGFFMKRIRWLATGQVSDHVGFMFQSDFATNLDNTTNSLAMRDAWGEYYLDRDKEYRVRLGLQRVPCSFDVWQGTRQRLAFDRADATDSCAETERDLGISLQWTPKYAQLRWRRMMDYMYGAGDWGMINLSVYNGQGPNRPEFNGNKTVGLRLAYPFELPGGRLLEIGMNAMRGMFNVDPGTPDGNTRNLFSLNQDKTPFRENYLDERVNVYIYYPPQPWGVQAEYVTGRGPKRGSDGIIRDTHLYGGYAQVHYEWKYSDLALANVYARWQEYYGGVKFLTGAPDGQMKEIEVGINWMPDPQWKITVAYAYTQRMNFEQMATFSNLNCFSGFRSGLQGVPVDNSACVPAQQFDARANLIRLQVIWFWN